MRRSFVSAVLLGVTCGVTACRAESTTASFAPTDVAQVSGTVVTANGQPASNVFVRIRMLDERYRLMTTSVDANEWGEFSLVVQVFDGPDPRPVPNSAPAELSAAPRTGVRPVDQRPTARDTVMLTFVPRGATPALVMLRLRLPPE